MFCKYIFSERIARSAGLLDIQGQADILEKITITRHHTILLRVIGDIQQLSLHALPVPKEHGPSPLFLADWCSIGASLSGTLPLPPLPTPLRLAHVGTNIQPKGK